MYFLIENNGTEHQLKVADNLKDYLEDQYGATVETSVGLNDEPVNIFDEDGKLIAAFENTPDEAVLNFHFGALT